MYQAVFRVLRRLDPEFAHELGMALIRLLGSRLFYSTLRARSRAQPALRVSTLGLGWESPVGLAAGFDKNARGIRGLHALGFGHVEVGTVTALAQPGNPKPRLFRLVDDQALINRMGFNNEGAEVIASRLKRLRTRHRELPVIGVNIGKSRVTPLADAVSDYVHSTRLLAPHADYLVVNVSSPNTPGLRRLQDDSALRPLLTAVLEHAGDTPVLVKIAPDLTDSEVLGVCDLVAAVGLSGIVATNTTIARQGLSTDPSSVAALGEGGLSGAPLGERSLQVLRLIRQRVPREICVVSVGGIFTGSDVQERLDAGATLVQAYTGFVYRGPWFAAHLTRELAALEGY